MKHLLIIGLLITGAVMVIFHIGGVMAIDLPHAPVNNINCTDCHTMHNASGVSLTTYASNSTLCESCHVYGLNSWPFTNNMQASPGVSGTSHRWDATMYTTIDPNSQYGLRPTANLQNLALTAQLQGFGNVVTCSVCHNQHSQSKNPWDPYGGPYTGMKGGDSGTAVGGSLNTLWTTGKTYWTSNGWQNYYVRMTNDVISSNAGQLRQISSNTSTVITFSSAWTTSIQAGDRFQIVGRHFQRINDDVNNMCEDCHYYRSPSWVTSVRTYTGNNLSHPVGKIFTNDAGRNVSDATQYNDVPLEPASSGWATQAGPRYELNGGNDANVTNNIILDSSKTTRCMSCHGIHYTDSKSETIDAP